ncbi:MAG: GMC family oxidoreductase [Rhizobiaceae bacterium]|nr:GMC family oxidoreductase [Rhizobiaceae bacterium]
MGQCASMLNQPIRFVGMNGTSNYDAVVVGSGPGGSSAAYKLSSQGLRVLVVEQGDFLKPAMVGPRDPIGVFLATTFRKGDFFGLVGGLTKFYGAALYRMRESDFRETRLESGISPAWPITYDELEPFYAEAEQLFRVHGSSDGDPNEPPRSGPYPYPPLPHDPLIAEMVERLQSTGTTVSPIPLGLDYGPQGSCRMCGTCDGHFCQVDAKMDAEIAVLRPALATGRVDIVTGAECLRIVTDEAGKRVTGVVIRINEEIHEIVAGTVVAGCGLTGTPLLLRRSRNAAHPEGLGNNGGALGRYMSGHHAGHVFVLTGWRPLGNRHVKTFGIMSHYEPCVTWPYPTGIVQIIGKMPVWDLAPRVLRPLARALATRCLSFFYMIEATPTREAGVIFKGDEIAGQVPPPRNAKTFARLRQLTVTAFRQAGYKAIAMRNCALGHPVGTARMGDDPSTSVTDRDGMVHGIQGLYVADASVLPSAGAVNTALTIVALALRTASIIVERRALPEDARAAGLVAMPEIRHAEI